MSRYFLFGLLPVALVAFHTIELNAETPRSRSSSTAPMAAGTEQPGAAVMQLAQTAVPPEDTNTIGEQQELLEKGEESYERLFIEPQVTRNTVVTRCQLTNKSGNIYRGARMIGRNTTNRTQRCTFTCEIDQSNGGVKVMECTTSLQPNQTAEVCGIYDSRYKLTRIRAVRDTCN